MTLRTITKYFPTGIKLTRPSSGYFLCVQLPQGVDALKLHQLAVSHSISVAPGHFFSPDGRFTSFVRINTGHPGDERLDSAVKTLGQIARSLMPQAKIKESE